MGEDLVEASLSFDSGDAAEDVLRTILRECGTIKAERFIELMIAALDAWELEASGELTKHDRRGFKRGYHGGKAEAYCKVARLLKLYPLVKKAGTLRTAGNDA